MTVSDVKVIVSENKTEIKSPKDIQSVIVTLQPAESSRQGAIETVKQIEINTKEPKERTEETNAEMKQFFSNQWQLEDKQIQVQMEGGQVE